jgi:hypothetical protein
MRLAKKFRGEGKATDEVREALVQAVPSAKAAEVEQALASTGFDFTTSPTLQRKVEQGKELMVIEPKVAKPVPETSLVPTGRGRTTFIAGERGISAGEQSRMGPTPVYSEAGPFEERLPPTTEMEPSLAETKSSSKLGRLAMPAAGAAAIGGGIYAASGKDGKSAESTERGEIKLRPSITGDTYKDIKFEPSPAELADIGPDYDKQKQLWDRYDSLTKDFQNQVKTEGMSIADPKKAAAQFLQRNQPATGPGIPATPLYGTEKEKQAVVQPAPPSGGMTPPVAPPSKEDGIAPAPGQAETGDTKQDDVEKTLGEWSKLQATVGAGKGVSRAGLESALKALDDLKPIDPTAPDTQRFVQARAEAYRAYQEKADRNDWLEVAQNLVSAITNYASARAAMGTRYEGGNIPLKGIDYGARTARAGREYEMELGQVGAEEKAAETAAERADRLKREQLALKRSGLQERIAAERERVREGETAQREAGRESMSLLRDIMNTRRADAKNAAYLETKTKELEAKGRQATTKDVDNQLKSLVAQEKATTARLKAANDLMSASGKTYDKALSVYATASGVSEEALKEQADKESPFYQRDKTYIKDNIAAKHATELSAEQQQIRRQIESLRGLKSGGQAAPATAAPTTQPAAQPSTTAPTGDTMVMVQTAAGKQGRIPASQLGKFLQDNPGSRQVQ